MSSKPTKEDVQAALDRCNDPDDKPEDFEAAPAEAAQMMEEQKEARDEIGASQNSDEVAKAANAADQSSSSSSSSTADSPVPKAKAKPKDTSRKAAKGKTVSGGVASSSSKAPRAAKAKPAAAKASETAAPARRARGKRPAEAVEAAAETVAPSG